MTRGKGSDPRPLVPSPEAQDPRRSGPPKTNQTRQATVNPGLNLSDSEAEVDSPTFSEGV
jgi:hypothetical protein